MESVLLLAVSDILIDATAVLGGQPTLKILFMKLVQVKLWGCFLVIFFVLLLDLSLYWQIYKIKDMFWQGAKVSFSSFEICIYHLLFRSLSFCLKANGSWFFVEYLSDLVFTNVSFFLGDSLVPNLKDLIQILHV